VPRLVGNFRHAARSLGRHRGATILIALTLALGIGANIAMYGVVDALLFRMPEHVQGPRELVIVPGSGNYLDYLDLAGSTRTLDVAAYTKKELSLGFGAEAVPIYVECVTQTYFPLLGARPRIGRWFTSGEEKEGDQAGVVLSHGLWQRRYGGSPEAIGSLLAISGGEFVIVGVSPIGFTGAEMKGVDAWILLTSAPEKCTFTGTNLLASRGGFWLTTIGRIRNGSTLAHAEIELHDLYSSYSDPPTMTGGESSRARAVEPLYALSTDRLRREGRVAMWSLVGSVLVFLVACLNVAGLLSVQAVERRGEIAVRLQLGATRMRLVGQIVAENAVLLAVCVAIAWVVGWWIRLTMEGLFPSFASGTPINGRILGVMLAFTLLAGTFTGVASAIHIFRIDPGRILRGGASLVSEGSRLRDVLLIGQIALAFVLIVCSGLFIRSIGILLEDPGYETNRVILVTADLQMAGYEAKDQSSIFDTMLTRVQHLPNVESASLSSHSMILSAGGTAFSAGVRGAAGLDSEQAIFNAVSPQYFSTLGTPVIRGRKFSPSDSGSLVAIVDTELSEALWPGLDPIGQCAWLGADCFEVVGTIRSRRHSTLRRLNHEIFVPSPQAGRRGALSIPKALFIRTAGSPETMIPIVAEVLRSVDHDLPFVDVQALAGLVTTEIRSWRVGATVFGVFGLLAVILAGIGVYGVLALSVEQRIAQIGLRMALGATPFCVLSSVVWDGMIMAGIGCLGGIFVALGVTHFIRSLLHEVAPTDPATFLVAFLVVGLMTLLGCVFPATRAVKVDPATALRGDQTYGRREAPVRRGR